MVKLAFGAMCWLLLIAYSNAASPLFVSAITSALATIPFSGGPMTTGLVGAKLGIGTKLLYYLGYFGRRSPAKPKKKAAAKPKTQSFGGSSSSQNLQPLSPAFQSNFPATSNFQNPFGGVDPSQLFQVLTAQGVDPNVVMEAINFAGNTNAAPNAFASNAAFGGFGTSGPFGGAGFPAGSGFSTAMPAGAGFPAGSGFSSMPGGAGFPTGSGFSSAISGGAGFPAGSGFSTAMPGGAGFPAGSSFSSMPGGSGLPTGSGFSSMPGGSGLPTGSGFSSMPGGAGFPAGSGFSSMPGGSGFSTAVPAQQFGQPLGGGAGSSLNEPDAPESSETENESEDDAESFFNFLTDMDENTCISRLICDIGFSPSFLGEFSENISSMVSTLKVPPTSRAFKYIEIMENGKKEGQCDTKFPECGDVSYEVVKNVAPSVSLPQNVNSQDINF